MNFGNMLKCIEDGTRRAYRESWSTTKLGKMIYVYVEKAKMIENKFVREPQLGWLGDEDMKIATHLNIYVDGTIATGWQPTQCDMFAIDWIILTEHGLSINNYSNIIIEYIEDTIESLTSNHEVMEGSVYGRQFKAIVDEDIKKLNEKIIAIIKLKIGE